MCLYPKLIRNPKYISNKKNGGIIPPCYDQRALMVPIGCQKCIECVNKKKREWQLRLHEDLKHRKGGKFITLTFSNESIKKIWKELPKNLKGYELDNAIATYATRHFLERWRKQYKRSLRHWLVTELGHNGTENIHMHGIVWPESQKQWNTITDIWQYGFTWIGKKAGKSLINYVNEKTVNYCVKYVNKIDFIHKTYKPIILASPGIGSGYKKEEKEPYLCTQYITFNAKTRKWKLRVRTHYRVKKAIKGDWERNKFNFENTNETYKTRSGHKISIPIYWRNKIYTEEERECLWLHKLNKNERWICGEKIAANNENEYYKLLEFHRKRNKQLGYGTDERNWKREEYEKQRRQLIITARINAPREYVSPTGRETD